jgi:hypothetical protein
MMVPKFILLSVGLLLVAASRIAAQQVIINEILYDTPGADDSCQIFTEICGPPGTHLTGWSLVGISGSTGLAYRTVHLSGVIPEDGYFVVANCGDSVYVDLNLDLGCDAGVDWTNAGGPSGDDCDGVELRHSNDVMDRICYGVCAPGHVCVGEGGENAPDAYPVGNISYSIARCPDCEDTDNNGEDWVMTVPTPGQSNQCPCQPQHYAINQIQEDESDGSPVREDEFVSIRGVATISSGVLNPLTTDFFIQDNDAGVNIVGAFNPVSVVHGDCVIVEGWVSHTCGLCQIASSGPDMCIAFVEVVGHTDVPEPAPVNCHDIGALGENYEGMLAKLECVTIVSTGSWPSEGEDADITVADASGLCTIHIDSDTDIDGQPRPEVPVAVTGIVGQYDCSSPFTEGHYLVPRSYSDIGTCSGARDLTAPKPQEFKLLGCWPNPFNSTTRIAFAVPKPGVVSVNIFSVLGQQVMTSSIIAASPGEHSYIWDGTNSAGEPVAAGLYFVRLQLDLQTTADKLLFLK